MTFVKAFSLIYKTMWDHIQEAESFNQNKKIKTGWTFTGMMKNTFLNM
jgi:hypothetical protein